METETFTTAKNIYQQAQNAFDKNELQQTGQLLSKLKIALIQCNSFLPSEGNSPSIKEHCLTKSSLELAVLYSIANKDVESYERFMKQLMPYYHDYSEKSNLASSTTYTDQILGLYLLFLLSMNRIGDFHSELEKLSNDQLENSIYLQHPVKIEQCLMEGNYGKVFLARENIPAKEYKFFMDQLVSTIRLEIGDCIEASFSKNTCLSMEEVARLLHFNGISSEFRNFLSTRNWSVENDQINFNSNIKASLTHVIVTESGSHLPKVDAIDTNNSMIDYAKEMEVII